MKKLIAVTSAVVLLLCAASVCAVYADTGMSTELVFIVEETSQSTTEQVESTVSSTPQVVSTEKATEKSTTAQAYSTEAGVTQTIFEQSMANTSISDSTSINTGYTTEIVCAVLLFVILTAIIMVVWIKGRKSKK